MSTGAPRFTTTENLTMLPKVCRVIVWVDGSGRTSACAGYELPTKGQQLRQKGFTPLYHFRAPLRRLRTGWFRLYHESLAFAVRHYGL